MNRELFRLRLIEAAQGATAFAREYVSNELPNCYAFQVISGKDGAFELFASPLPLSVDEVVSQLLRDGRAPQWIDVSVRAVTSGVCRPAATLLQLLCSDAFVPEKQLYYHERQSAPFAIKSPRFPPKWSPDAGSRFDLYAPESWPVVFR